jgi:alanine dehydrogenase
MRDAARRADLYTYLHLAPDPEQTKALVASGAVCIAYETITGPNGGLPLLAPMSEVAGRMSIQAGAAHLEKSKAAWACCWAACRAWRRPYRDYRRRRGRHQCLQMAVGIGARVTILDKNVDRLRQLDLVYGNRIATMYSNAHSIRPCWMRTW